MFEGHGVAQAVEWYIAITALVAGASHVFRPHDWAEAYGQLHRLGRPGAFINGAISLVPGALIIAGHPSWKWPGAVVTGFGWLMVIKGTVCFLAPQKGLRSMEHGSRSPRSFIAGGLILLAIGAWAGHCLWERN